MYPVHSSQAPDIQNPCRMIYSDIHKSAYPYSFEIIYVLIFTTFILRFQVNKDFYPRFQAPIIIISSLRSNLYPRGVSIRMPPHQRSRIFCRIAIYSLSPLPGPSYSAVNIPSKPHNFNTETASWKSISLRWISLLKESLFACAMKA